MGALLGAGTLLQRPLSIGRQTQMKYTLIVLANDAGEYDIDASRQAAARALPDLEIGQVTPLEEHEVGAWIARNRARRCRCSRDVLTTPERLQPVVIDADLAW